jgi:hypothetical protein
MTSNNRSAMMSHTVEVPCSCGEKIYLPLSAVIQCKPAVCAGCGGRLTIDPSANAGALASIERLLDKLENVGGANVRNS